MSEMNEREIKCRFEAISQFEPNPEVIARDLEKARKSLIAQTTETQPKQHDTWRIIMRSKTFKLAAAAIIIIAVFLGIHEIVGIPRSSSVALADVIKPILNARTASLDIRIGSPNGDVVIHDDVMGSRIRRTVSNLENATILIDLEQQKLVNIDHDKKTVIYLGLDGLPSFQNYVEHLRNLILRLQDHPDVQVDNQGLREMNGQEYFVFVANIGDETITIWADSQTALPVRIEHQTPNTCTICDNMQFDVEFDESLFSTKVPDGYTTQDVGAVDFSNSSESVFIESLRIWAEIIEDEHFPDSINLEDIAKIGPKLQKGLEKAGLTEEQQTNTAIKWGQGLVFIRFFKGQGKYEYAGQGVKLGDGEKPIFWYQPKDSETWRVIYGDLRVEDVTAENLPK
ncbi:MAG: hypothetical protein JXM79_24705 [Sedimentisphaerales bacterium]|nr:hypothetical protein [Sedimentisphaerales bacterium]